MHQPERLETDMAADVGRRVGSDNPVPLLQIRSAFSMRMVGPNFDISLRLSTVEDFEIVERLLAKAKASLCNADSASHEP